MASSGSDEGYPVLQHIRELVDNDIIWALAIQGRYWVTKSQRHKDKLCLEASFMFQYYTSEADVYLKPAGK